MPQFPHVWIDDNSACFALSYLTGVKTLYGDKFVSIYQNINHIFALTQQSVWEVYPIGHSFFLNSFKVQFPHYIIHPHLSGYLLTFSFF